MKIALLFWGLTKCLEKTMPNIKECILDVLKENNIEYKIFLHTYYFEGYFTDKRTGENNIILNFNEYKLLKPDYFLIENQDEVKKKLNIKKYHQFNYTYIENTVENLICALYSQFQVTKLLQKQVEGGDEFNYIWFIRPDVIFNSKIEIKWLKWINKKRFLVPIFGSSGGLNDRMGIMMYQHALVYGKRLLFLRDYNKFLNGEKISSEKFLDWVMRDFKPKKINFLFKRLRTNNTFHHLDQKLF